MKTIDFTHYSQAFIHDLSKEWLLLTAGTKEQFNTMTVNWGGVGYLWNKPVVYLFVRPERYTFEFIERQELFSLSFLGKQGAAVHAVTGIKSGREIDKVAATGLVPLFTEHGTPLFEQARLSLECKKLYKQRLEMNALLDPDIEAKWYTHKGTPHYLYIAEVLQAWEGE